MDAMPVLTCVQFASDGVTCSQTQWVYQSPSFFPPMSVADGVQLGGAIMFGCVVIWASKLVRRGA